MKKKTRGAARSSSVIDKMRVRFTWICMGMVSMVIAAVLAALLVSTYRSNFRNCQRTLEMALNSQTREPMMGPGQEGQDRPEDNNSPFIPVVVVTVDSQGQITDTDAQNAVISDDTLNKAVSSSFGSNKMSGKLASLHLIYEKKEMKDQSTRIAFISSSNLTQPVRSLLISAALIIIPVLIILYVVCHFLASIAVKPVQRSYERQKQFTADASHELKTPLSVIMANNQIMMHHLDEAVKSQQQWLLSTRDEGERMKKLINDMLFLAKEDADKMPLVPVRDNLSNLVQSSVLTFEPVAFEGGMSIESSVQDDCFAVYDVDMIKQLIHILLDNALKYGEKGTSINVRLSSSKNKKGKEMLSFSVTNFGKLISAQDLPHIFERFYRADPSRTSSGKSSGFGLGLSIAKSIADQNHGTLTCTSSQKEGTTFTFTIARN